MYVCNYTHLISSFSVGHPDFAPFFISGSFLWNMPQPIVSNSVSIGIKLHCTRYTWKGVMRIQKHNCRRKLSDRIQLKLKAEIISSRILSTKNWTQKQRCYWSYYSQDKHKKYLYSELFSEYELSLTLKCFILGNFKYPGSVSFVASFFEELIRGKGVHVNSIMQIKRKHWALQINNIFK